jgi:hypothetical protein
MVTQAPSIQPVRLFGRATARPALTGDFLPCYDGAGQRNEDENGAIGTFAVSATRRSAPNRSFTFARISATAAGSAWRSRDGADALGSMTASIALAEDQRTATIESKTNFFAAIPKGNTAHAVCVPLHTGRTTIVLQTNITRSDGKLAAIVTQTQIVLPATEQPPDKSRLRASSPPTHLPRIPRAVSHWLETETFLHCRIFGRKPDSAPDQAGSMLFLKMLYGSVNISNRSVSAPPPGKVEPPTKYRFGPITPAPKPWLPSGIGASDIQVPVLRS